MTQVQAEFEEQQQAHEQVIRQSSNMLAQFNHLQTRNSVPAFVNVLHTAP